MFGAKRKLRKSAGNNAETLIDWYGVTGEGNFEGSNILYRPTTGDLVRSPEVEEGRQILFEERKKTFNVQVSITRFLQNGTV